MHKLILELIRLYLSDDTAGSALAERIGGRLVGPAPLGFGDARTRALMIRFRKIRGASDAHHWARLCEVANALQTELGLPAPAVSVSGADGFGLWLSLATPIPRDTAQQFLQLMQDAYFPDLGPDVCVAGPLAELPPYIDRHSGKWAAFIHAGMGASFADDAGLEMAPPLAGRVAFLESLESIDDAQFALALARLRPQALPAPQPPAVAVGAVQPGAPQLLLKDATLEDIVRHLHAKNIEPTFRHLLGTA